MAGSRSETTLFYALTLICLIHLAAGQTFQYSRGWTNGKRSNTGVREYEMTPLVSRLPGNASRLFRMISSVKNGDDIKELPLFAYHIVINKKKEPVQWVKNKWFKKAEENRRLKNTQGLMDVLVNILDTLKTDRK